MMVPVVVYSSRFVSELRRLPRDIAVLAAKKEAIFKLNPLHPSLRLHPLKGKLKGLWSITVTGGYRLIFKRKDNGDILFVSIGKHDIYKSL